MKLYQELGFITHHASGEPLLFCRRSGGFSSLFTSECIFTRAESWVYFRENPACAQEFEHYCFHTLEMGKSYLGKTPEEISIVSRSALKEFMRKHRGFAVEVRKIEEKPKIVNPSSIEGGLF